MILDMNSIDMENNLVNASNLVVFMGERDE